MEHSQEVLNQPAASNLIAFEQETPMTLLDVTMDNISKEKVAQSNNKADCFDEVTAELIKPGGVTIAEELSHRSNRVWRTEDVGAYLTTGDVMPS